ncbi:hypothetical protein KSP40_PGU011536 [Platanthera guangdongensis]|uniref:AFG1-like ATPase n=1 Tax=Platanthera guangdongensis TaxID=2320717 RepID=A0ABR2MLQ1_9ASPA
MMRRAAQALRHARYFSQIRGDRLILSDGNQKISNLRGAATCALYRPFIHKKINRYLIQTVRSLSISVASDSTGASADLGRSGPFVEYERRIASGELVDGDAFQVDTIMLLQRLYQQLVENEDSCQLDRYSTSHKAARSRWLWSRFVPQSGYSPVKGLYLYGGVGTGKTMLMDLFYDQLPSNWRRRRRHFHDFMLDVHRRLQMHKGVADPLEVVAGEISDESILLCLDEFMVTDVADALILNRLFKHLFSKGIVLLATSNRSPDSLYEGGLQRDLFLPFIDSLKERCVVHEIGSSTDYRRLTSAEQGFYFIGVSTVVFKQRFLNLIGKETPHPQVVEVAMGRELQVPLGANGCAYFPFVDLCDKPLGAADYLGLFAKFHTLALDGVPRFGIHNRSAAYRFVTLVDVMYENRARFLCNAEASPSALLEKIVTVAEARRISPRSSSRSQKGDDLELCVDNELGFAKDRTISRLIEMSSREYLEQHEQNIASQMPPSASLDKKQEAEENADVHSPGVMI